MRCRRRRLRSPVALFVYLSCALSSSAAQPPPGVCRWIGPGADLNEVLATLSEGATACLEPGEHFGPLKIAARIHLWGPPEAVVRSRGSGTTISIEADGASLSGFGIDGSGSRQDLLDAAVRVRADDVRVEGLSIRRALFGILAEQSHRVAILGNEIVGNATTALGMRGDAIRIWEVRDSRIEGNRLRDGRDLVIWYSPHNRIVGNEVSGGRYGTHLMYSHDNVIEGNRYRRNVVGVFVMYSRELRIHRNLFAESLGAAGVGFGAKESGSLDFSRNLVVGNTTGIWLDTSPLDPQNQNSFVENVIRLGDAGVVFHGRVDGNLFEGNSLRDNLVPVRVEGRGDALASSWRNNDFDDYQGYDLDDDGLGDLPFELRSLTGELTSRAPALAFFRGSVAMSLIEAVGRLLPLFEAKTLLVDPAPRMAPLDLSVPGAPGEG